MKRPLSLATSFVALATVALMVGCASLPKPSSLQRAEDRLASADTVKLTSTRPGLVRQARELTDDSREAWKRGDVERSDIQAQMALQKLQTANHFEARDQAFTRQKAMARALVEVDREKERVDQQNEALKRFRNAEGQFRQLESELAQLRADDRSAKAQAQRALVAARRKQSEAIGAGAPAAAEPVYNEGRFLIETSMEALSAGLFEESMTASAQAIERFEASMSAAADSDVVSRKSQKDAAARQLEAADAQKAIDEAETARAGAIAQRMPDKEPEQFQKGTYLVELANKKQAAGDYDAATARAREATTLFKGSEAGSPRQTAQKAIADAEEARGAVIGLGITDLNLTRQADYNLQLAKGALQGGDFVRAKKLADDAKRDYDGLRAYGPRLAMMGFNAPSAPPGPGNGGIQSSDAWRREVDAKIVSIQFERAEALGRNLDQSCPATFREYDALIILARQRYDARDYTQAVEFAIRATERLRKCETPTRPGLAAKAPAAPTLRAAAPLADVGAAAGAVKAESPAERKIRLEARRAIAKAQRSFARATAKKPEPARLEEPALLLSGAQKWFEQQAYEEAALLAGDANKLLEDLLKELEPPKAGAGAAKPGAAKPGAAAKTPAPAVCKGLDKKIDDARLAQASVGTRVGSDNDEKRYRRAISSLLSADRLNKEGRCKDAEFLLTEAALVFEALAQKGMPSTGPTVLPGAATAEVIKTGCPDLDSRFIDARVQLPLVANRVKDEPSRQRFTRVDSLLRSAETFAKDSQCAPAKVLLAEAEANLKELGPPVAVAGKIPKAAKGTTAPVAARDPAARANAVEAIGRADVLRASREHHRDKTVYTTGLRLLDQARAALAERPNDALRLAQQAGFAFETLSADQPTPGVAATASEPWKEAYQVILDVLIERDRARDAAGPAEKKTLERGQEFVRKSRASWDAKDYLAARRWAQAAGEEFKAVLDQASARIVAERDAVSEKNSLADKDKTIAARDAELKRRQTEIDRQRAERQALIEAEDAMRKAEVEKARCEATGCAKRDAALATSAADALANARDAMQNKDYPAAKQAATRSLSQWKALLEMKPVFAIPRGISRVTRQGDKLVVDPRIKFVGGRDDVTADSMEGVDQLARVLIANADTLEQVRLMGYSDSRGNPTLNLALSQRRAEAIRTLLINRGVPATLLVAQGRGAVNPVADNRSPAGRALNRRVEVELVNR